jgi:hypothetical protein
MEPNLRPLSLSEILDRTAQMYRARFFVYLGIAAVPSVTLLVFAALAFLLLGWAGTAAADVATQRAQMVVAGLGVMLLVVVALPVWLVTSSLGWAALSHAAARASLGGNIGIRDQYRAVWPRGWRYIGLVLLLGLVLVAVPVVVLVAGTIALGVGGVAAGGADPGSVARVALFFLIVAAAAAFSFWMLLRVSLVFPAAVVEDLAPMRAIKRAVALSRGTRGRILVLFLLGAAISWILALSVFLPLSIALALIPGAGTPQHAQMLGRILIFSWYGFSFAMQAVVRPVYGIALTLFYFDQRIRNEGFDIEWMMRAAGLEAHAEGPALAPPASAGGETA